jgi:hypothetical protein
VPGDKVADRLDRDIRGEEEIAESDELLRAALGARS